MITKEELQEIIEKVTLMYDWEPHELMVINDYVSTIKYGLLENLNELIERKKNEPIK
jgi:hypothetical protein